MSDKWSVDLSVLPAFPSDFADSYYASKTQSDRHRQRSYKFTTESYVSLPTLKTKKCTGQLFFSFLFKQPSAVLQLCSVRLFSFYMVGRTVKVDGMYPLPHRIETHLNTSAPS